MMGARPQHTQQQRGEAGFTLVEMLVATAILGVVMSLLVAVMYQFSSTTAESNSRLAVLGDVGLATQALASDVNSASVAAINNQFSMTLTQPDPNLGPARTVVYTVAPPLLLRRDAGGELPVARHVTADTTFTPVGIVTGTQLVAVKLVSAVGSQSQTSTLQLNLRPLP